MTKPEFIKAVREEAGDAPKVETVIEAVFSVVQDATKANGDKLTIPGFGTFKRRERKARTARNPKTGEAINVPASSVLAFKPAKDKKE